MINSFLSTVQQTFMREGALFAWLILVIWFPLLAFAPALVLAIKNIYGKLVGFLFALLPLLIGYGAYSQSMSMTKEAIQNLPATEAPMALADGTAISVSILYFGAIISSTIFLAIVGALVLMCLIPSAKRRQATPPQRVLAFALPVTPILIAFSFILHGHIFRLNAIANLPVAERPMAIADAENLIGKYWNMGATALVVFLIISIALYIKFPKRG